MPTADLLVFLSLIIALSAYVATIRLRVLDKIKTETDRDKRFNLKQYACLLTVPDLALLFSGTTLFLHGFWDQLGLFLPARPTWLLSAAIYAFCLAIVCFIFFHLAAILRTWRA